MKLNYAHVLLSLPALYVAAGELGTDAEQLTSDPGVKEELDANPVLKAAVEEGAQEWRQVEEYAEGVKKSNFWNFFTRAGRLTEALSVLEGTVAKDVANAQLADALATTPKTKALLVKARAELAALEAAL